jgi:hypothetical protein
MSSAVTSAKSGIQKEVFALYRNILREAIKKDRSSIVGTNNGATTTASGGSNPGTSSGTRPAAALLKEKDSMTAHARHEFRKQASQVNRKDFRMIEYKIRHGYKQIKLLQMPGVIKFNSTTYVGGIDVRAAGPGGTAQH